MKTQRPRSPRSAPGESFEDQTLRLTSDSVHDLTSPVNQLGSVMDLMAKKFEGGMESDTELLFGFLRTATTRLQNLMAGLTTYAQIASTPLVCRRCQGDEVLNAAVAMVQPAIGRTQASVTRDALPEIYCDPGQVSYVFAGLIDNSIKFRGENRPEIHIAAVPRKKSCVFSVSDNGIGIDPRFHERIFGTFKRIHTDTYPGSGVGLAIAWHVMQRHKGRIWVESELGQGATFFLSLPAKAPAVAQQS